MALKKKVTYSAAYNAETDAINTPLNSLLQQVASLILSQNPGLSVLDTITYGSSRMEDAPLYNNRPDALNADCFANRYYESDVIFIGTDKNNVCLSINFFQGELVVAMNMTPHMEQKYVDAWQDLGLSKQLPFYAVGKASRSFNFSADYVNWYSYTLPYRIVDNAISISVLYWDTTYSRGYSFINGTDQSDGSDLVIYTTDEGNGKKGLGGAIWTWGRISSNKYYQRPCILVWSFSENLSNNMAKYIGLSYYTNSPSEAEQVICNAQYDIRQWFCADNNYYYYCMNGQFFAIWHTLGGSTGCVDGNYKRVNSMKLYDAVNRAYEESQGGIEPGSTNSYFVSVLCSAYNLPRLDPGQAYIRRMRIPGWNANCKGEIYLLWSPSLVGANSGDIVEVGDKKYAVITEGALCWVTRAD